MRVTYHAAERFLQRVFQFTNYSKKQINDARKLIERDIRNLRTDRSRFILPSFPDFLGVVTDGALVTIIPKKS